MRRLLTLVLSTLTVVVLSAMFLAGPALATEESEPAGEEAAAELEGFGAGDWDGLILAAITGVLVGIVVFADSKPGEIGHAGHH